MGFSIPFLFCSFQAFLFPIMTEILGNDGRPQKIEPQYTASETLIDGGMLGAFSKSVVHRGTINHNTRKAPRPLFLSPVERLFCQDCITLNRGIGHIICNHLLTLA